MWKAAGIGEEYDMLLLALFVGHFLTTLHSHLDVTCSCYFWSSFFNVDDESLHILDNQPTN